VRKNPYDTGSPCYIAYETGYRDAILDAIVILDNNCGRKCGKDEGQNMDRSDEEEHAAGMP